MPASVEPAENGHRLSNDQFEAIICTMGETIGITHLASRGDPKRETVTVKEQPMLLRLATDAPREDFVDWQFHAASGTEIPHEDDWGIALELHKKPTNNGAGPRCGRLIDTLLGNAWYTDIYYPGYCWYRRMVNLPKEWAGKPIVFVLGGGDTWDWRNYWVYLNGEQIGRHSYDTTYTSAFHDVPRYVVKPGDANYAKLKFGEENLLAVQARLLDRRTPEMHRLDLERYSGASFICDQYVSAGEPTRDVSGFTLKQHSSSMDGDNAVVELLFTHPTEPLVVTARYWLAPNDSAIHKRIVVRNEGNAPMTLLEADVSYLAFEKVQYFDGGHGWPTRIGEDWFAGVAHPAGISRFDKTGVRLQCNPGVTLDPTHSHDYTSKTAVIGAGDGRRAFRDYLQAHGRRKPEFLNMYSLYGLCEIATGLYEKVELTEPLVMKNLEQMTDLQKLDIKFDYYCIDTGWNDPSGDLKQFHPVNFPHGSDETFKKIHDLGLKPLLWMSPAQGPPAFRFGTPNAHLKPEDNVGAGWFLCCASPNWRTMLREAMLHHVKNNGVRGFKLDEVAFYCGRTNHGHMMNKYGVEATMDAFIDTLNAVKQECPDVLLMLYWRFMSPWWLLHADTLYQRRLQMEGSTPSPFPSRIIRQSVTVSLDQGHDWNWDLMPLIGQDSLGVWLSNTRWGSWMGAEGWREAWIMDFVRGNMMHQLWGDLSLLNEDDLVFMQSIAKWTSENSDLLKHPKRILGSPWRQEPYGYACCNANRGLIVINNAQFSNDTVQVALDETIGLSPGKAYDVTWIYKNDSVKSPGLQRVEAGQMLEVQLGSFEACMADIRAAGSEAISPPNAPASAPQRVHVRPIQNSYRKLDWYAAGDQATLALVMNGRITPTTAPTTLQAGPDRTDERDRDIVQEHLTTPAILESKQVPSKLLFYTRFDRDGIAWHHLAPFEIIKVSAKWNGKPLEAKVTPKRWHEEAGAWSWVLHEFDVPAGASEIALAIEAAHSKTVSLTFEAWHADA